MSGDCFGFYAVVLFSQPLTIKLSHRGPEGMAQWLRGCSSRGAGGFFLSHHRATHSLQIEGSDSKESDATTAF